MSKPFLTNLGVQPADQARSPTVQTYPPAFNSNAQALWYEVIPRLVMTGRPGEDWGRAVRDFMRLCEDRSIFPFVNASRNDELFEFLRAKRKAVVEYIDRVGLFKEVKVRDVSRTCQLTDRGFQLEIHGICRLLDPSFPQWLGQQGYVRGTTGDLLKEIETGLTFFACNTGTNDVDRWHIGYRINSEAYPDIPNYPEASRNELERFVLDVLWEPAFRMQRPQGLLHRLI